MKNEWLVLDWDGTLAYSSLLNENEMNSADLDKVPTFIDTISLDRDGIEGKTALYIRPNADKFLKRISEKYNLILWSFGTKKYIQECMQVTGFNKFFSRVIIREMMTHPVKDLFLLNIPLSKIAIVDDANSNFGLLNPINCIDIPSWYPYFPDDPILNVMDIVIQYHFENILSQYNKHGLEEKRRHIIQRLNSMSQKHKAN